MSTIFLLESKDYEHDGYETWTPDVDVAFATEALAQVEANRRNHDLTCRAIAKHIKGQRDQIASWDRRRKEHDALYDAGLREAPFDVVAWPRPTYMAPPLRNGAHRISDEGMWSVLSVPVVES